MEKRGLPFLAAAVIVLFLSTYWLLNFTGNNTEFAKGRRYIVTIEPGMTTSQIATLLHKHHLVKTPESFRIQARLLGLERHLEAGQYEIVGGMSNKDIVHILAKGQVYTVTFTVPEGFNVKKIGAKLEAEGLGNKEKFMEAAKNYTAYPYMETDNPHVMYKAEGFLFPSTYRLGSRMTEKEIVAHMVKTFNQQINSTGIAEEAKKQEMPIRKLVNLAAMVELEAVYQEEMPKIAGVFLKRLNIAMPIQSDTSIQYILGKQKSIISFKDTRLESPYNTYTNPGLPPGPICSPGLAAMQAVLHPDVTDKLYFVADNTGHHYFTATYNEHLQAIKRISREAEAMRAKERKKKAEQAKKSGSSGADKANGNV